MSEIFQIEAFSDPTVAAMNIWDYIRQYWTVFDSLSLFKITHSINQEDIVTEQVGLDNLYEQLVEFIRDLDSQEGVYFDNEEGMHFDESPEAQDRIYRDEKSCGLGGEGILLIKNSYASAKGDFPFIVIKPSHYALCGDLILKNLHSTNLEEYTAKVAPAVYLEFGER